MTNSQCIEIAEKVWRLKTDTRGSSETLWRDFDRVLINLEELCELVNSWSGFGRTVEAMAERGLNIEINRIDNAWPGRRVIFVISMTELVTISGHKFAGWSQDLKDNNLIEATHLAALEALKK